MLYELSQLFLEQLQHTLYDIADVVRPLREDGELKESPESKEWQILIVMGNCGKIYKILFLLILY